MIQKPLSLKLRRENRDKLLKVQKQESNKQNQNIQGTKEEKKVDDPVNNSLISNTSTIKLIVPPYSSPPGPSTKSGRDIKVMGTNSSNPSGAKPSSFLQRLHQTKQIVKENAKNQNSKAKSKVKSPEVDNPFKAKKQNSKSSCDY